MFSLQPAKRGATMKATAGVTLVAALSLLFGESANLCSYIN